MKLYITILLTVLALAMLTSCSHYQGMRNCNPGGECPGSAVKMDYYDANKY